MYSLILRVLLLLSERKWLMLSLIISNLLFALLTFIEPVLYKNVVDGLIAFEQKDGFQKLIPVLLTWGGLGVLIIGIRLFVSIASDRMTQRYYNKSVMNFFTYVLALPLEFHTSTHSGKLSKIIQRGGDAICRIQLECFRKILPDIFTLLMTIPFVLAYHFKMGVIVLLLGICIAIIAFLTVIRTGKAQEGIEHYFTELSHQYSDIFSNMQIVKSFTLKDFTTQKLDMVLNKRLHAQIPILNWWGFLVSLSQITRVVMSIIVISFGSYFYVHHEMTIGEIVMFLSISIIFLQSIESLLWSIESIFWQIAPLKEYFEVLDTEITVRDHENAKNLQSVQGAVIFHDVSFTYDRKRTVLKHIDFIVEPGEKVAFVGHTGSGKTTLSSLLLRFYDATLGQITIDGHDIRNITQKSLRQNIGVVFQENTLFNTSIRENIILDKENVSEAQIQHVIERANAKSFLERLPRGLDTIVGERGMKLSGGEKQRIALARAFLKDARILILDEATSALDAETEAYLQESLKELMKGRTTFIIAHRLSTIRDADRILVLDQGSIVEDGTYTSLIEQDGYFARLVRAQTKGFIS